MAILGHGSNTVAANYGSGYALDSHAGAYGKGVEVTELYQSAPEWHEETL